MKELTALELVMRFRGREVVKKISLKVKSGETVGLLGPNGAGKTTTFYMVVGLTSPDKGKILLDDKDITSIPMFKRARMGIGYLPQEPSVFRKLSVRNNLMAILEHTRLNRTQRNIKCDSVLEELGISHIRDSMAYTLSGGERRRVEIGRALAVSPSFMLLDEPFAGIDPIAVKDIQGIINTLKNKGIGILITDHNVRETLEITDRTYIINEGTIIDHGNPNEIAGSEKCRRIYLGENFKL